MVDGSPPATSGRGRAPGSRRLMRRIEVNPAEVQIVAIRAQGPGGQNVNKVSSAAQLHFDVHASSLPEEVKLRLLAQSDQRIGADGVVVIKAQEHRSLPMNRDAALARLQAMVDSAARPRRVRKPTAPTRASQRRRLDTKTARGQIKAARGKVQGGE